MRRALITWLVVAAETRTLRFSACFWPGWASPCGNLTAHPRAVDWRAPGFCTDSWLAGVPNLASKGGAFQKVTDLSTWFCLCLFLLSFSFLGKEMGVVLHFHFQNLWCFQRVLLTRAAACPRGVSGQRVTRCHLGLAHVLVGWHSARSPCWVVAAFTAYTVTFR